MDQTRFIWLAVKKLPEVTDSTDTRKPATAVWQTGADNVHERPLHTAATGHQQPLPETHAAAGTGAVRVVTAAQRRQKRPGPGSKATRSEGAAGSSAPSARAAAQRTRTQQRPM